MGDSRRSNSRSYNMTIRDGNQNLSTVIVCKHMYMTTLDINTSRINYALQKKSKKEYLSKVSSIEKMYRLYKTECDLDRVNPVSTWVYHNIFNTQFNLSFHIPKDTCKRCDIFQVRYSMKKINRKS